MTHGQRCTFSVGNVRVVSNLPFASATSALPWFRERERKKEKKKKREREGGGLRSTGCIISSSISNVVVRARALIAAHSRPKNFKTCGFARRASEANISTYYNGRSILRRTKDRALSLSASSLRVIPRHFPQSDLSSFAGITGVFLFPCVLSRGWRQIASEAYVRADLSKNWRHRFSRRKSSIGRFRIEILY